MNNEIFSVLRENQFLAVFRDFFADVSKNFKTQYLKNRSFDEAHLLTKCCHTKYNSDRPLDMPYYQNSNFEKNFADHAFLPKNEILNFVSKLSI